ncbi:MAG: glucokinase [Proteobacteria bacterium]|nr:glucokinase [Pseudomonadota bacterium]
MRELIADIGATNARFALADRNGFYQEHVLQCADYADLADAIRSYLHIAKPENSPRRAAVAIAGPVAGDIFKMTNHPWAFSVKETAAALGLESLHLMNDFEALAHAVPHMRQEYLQRVSGPAVPAARAPKGIVGPGTGLGMASIVWGGEGYIPVPGEGGHATMPIKTRREFDLFEYLLKHKYHHISAERVCSGKGLVNIYNGLRGLDGRDDLPDREPHEISAAALDRSCPLCRESLDLMMAFLGRASRTLALTLGAFGGIYIAGGIVNKLGRYFYLSGFEKEFIGEGRFTDYMRGVPVFVILHEFPAFIGLQADLFA